VPRLTTAELSIEILDYLFNEFDIWAMIHDGRLSSEIIPDTPTPSTAWPNATAMILKHFKPNGKHIATTHCVKDNKSGDVLHWDAKDLRLRDVRLWRP